jgi:hypothetical protein
MRSRRCTRRVSACSRISPTGWIGVVAIDGAILATAPSPREAELVGAALSSLADVEAVSEVLAQRLAAAEVLGPASLSYLPVDSQLVRRTDRVEAVPVDSTDLALLLGSVDHEDAGESGLASITSDLFVARANGVVVSAAGYQRWLSAVAHLCVLTAVSERDSGLATRTAGAATADAVAHGLLPQWRARSAASRRVATHLGFEKLGWQLSLKLST